MVTVSFLSLDQLFHVFSMRDASASVLDNDVTRAPYVWLALALPVTLLIAATYLPVLSTVLELRLSGFVMGGHPGAGPPATGERGYAPGFVFEEHFNSYEV